MPNRNDAIGKSIGGPKSRTEARFLYASACPDYVELLIPVDFNKCVTQLHRERTEQVTAVYPVADLARLLEGRGGGANAGCTDRLRGAPELVRCHGQCRKVAGARGSVDLPFHLDCRVTEFPQQRIDGGAIVAEPSRKDVAVDCGGGFRQVRRAANTALTLNGQPAFQRRA